MRLTLLSGLLLLLIAWPAAAPPATAQSAAGQREAAQRAFERGNQRYAGGDYTAALQQYEAALQSDWTSGALFYNTASTHYRLGHLGEAVRYFEKARPLLPAADRRLRHNLTVVRGKLTAPIPAALPIRVRVQDRVAAWLPPGVALAAGLALFLAALGWWTLARTDPAAPLRPRRRVAALAGAGVLLAVIGLLLSRPSAGTRAVALGGPLTLRTTPAAEADSAAALPEGTVLRLTGRADGWREVRASTGDAGWARADALGEI